MIKNISHSVMLIVLFLVVAKEEVNAQTISNLKTKNNFTIDLSGKWLFQSDASDEGIAQKWYNKKLDDKIRLPDSMTTNGKGDDITVKTPWTGSIFDSSWYIKPEYARYRQPGNIKIPFWLQPVKYYKGGAWYQRTVKIPASWKGRHIEFFIERSHWETTVWVDNKLIGKQNSLAAPHIFNLTDALTQGEHKLTIRIDNRIKDITVGINAHSITDHTQTNWNGMIGKLFITARPAVYIDDVQLYPDIKKKQVVARVRINNMTGNPVTASIQLLSTSINQKAERLKLLTKIVEVKIAA